MAASGSCRHQSHLSNTILGTLNSYTDIVVTLLIVMLIVMLISF